jgi:plasmid stability protein
MQIMKAITIRNIPPELQEKLEEESAAAGSSVASTVIRLLLKAAGLGPSRPRLFDDLDELAGAWSDEEADAFDRIVGDQRSIDPELWR